MGLKNYNVIEVAWRICSANLYICQQKIPLCLLWPKSQSSLCEGTLCFHPSGRAELEVSEETMVKKETSEEKCPLFVYSGGVNNLHQNRIAEFKEMKKGFLQSYSTSLPLTSSEDTTMSQTNMFKEMANEGCECKIALKNSRFDPGEVLCQPQ
jgi:hypothetical protein